jgi:hypothetical protein
LHVSTGGAHAPHAQVPGSHVRDPVVPQVVVQLPVAPAQHAKTSSHAPLQSSSTPLHVSAGGLHTPHEQTALHVREPVVPHPVVQLPIEPRQHANPSSHAASQFSSIPSQSSGAPANATERVSSQSSAGTPPVDGHAVVP